VARWLAVSLSDRSGCQRPLGPPECCWLMNSEFIPVSQVTGLES
jgi:hypothetical protein